MARDWEGFHTFFYRSSSHRGKPCTILVFPEIYKLVFSETHFPQSHYCKPTVQHCVCTFVAIFVEYNHSCCNNMA